MRRSLRLLPLPPEDAQVWRPAPALVRARFPSSCARARPDLMTTACQTPVPTLLVQGKHHGRSFCRRWSTLACSRTARLPSVVRELARILPLAPSADVAVVARSGAARAPCATSCRPCATTCAIDAERSACSQSALLGPPYTGAPALAVARRRRPRRFPASSPSRFAALALALLPSNPARVRFCSLHRADRRRALFRPFSPRSTSARSAVIERVLCVAAALVPAFPCGCFLRPLGAACAVASPSSLPAHATDAPD